MRRVADKEGVTRRCHWALWFVFLGAQFGCHKAPDSPEQVANQFLRAVKRENWSKAWTYLSAPSQEKSRADSARMIADAPYYAEQFRPERLACSRFDSMIAGSARVQKIEGTNATLVVQRKEPTGFALPGFSPMGRKKVPDEVLAVQENSVWKIDLVRPVSAERDVLAARQKAMQRELEAINAYRATNRPPPPPPPPLN